MLASETLSETLACAITGVAERAPQPTRIHDGEASVSRSPRQKSTRKPDFRTAIRLFPSARGATILELAEQLRPDRDHPDEQRQRSQRRRLLHENLQHHRLLYART